MCLRSKCVFHFANVFSLLTFKGFSNKCFNFVLFNLFQIDHYFGFFSISYHLSETNILNKFLFCEWIFQQSQFVQALFTVFLCFLVVIRRLCIRVQE